MIYFLYAILNYFHFYGIWDPFLENPGNHIFKSILKTKSASPSRQIIPFCFVIVFVRENRHDKVYNVFFKTMN